MGNRFSNLSDTEAFLAWDAVKTAIAKVEPLVMQEYVAEWMEGNTDGFSQKEQEAILKFLDDIVIYSANRGDI